MTLPLDLVRRKSDTQPTKRAPALGTMAIAGKQISSLQCSTSINYQRTYLAEAGPKPHKLHG
jgi:hypothetical protein